ncbi:MAG: thiol-disulfide oxidoreductase DCC family protein [Chitinophagales bacterium]|nr:thiol-disulfide oxidoreductase DCC family protein [Chitinophagales bacterium]
MNNIVLFDGVCNFCNSSVQLVIRNDKQNQLKFASLQSTIGQQLLEQYQVPTTVDSIVFIQDEKAYIKSTAALKILQFFPWYWKPLLIFYIVPAPLRNIVYDFIAKNRYNWFGKQEACMLPTKEQQAKFLG